MAAALAALGRAAGLAAGPGRLLRACGATCAAEGGLSRRLSSAERPKRPLTAYFRFVYEEARKADWRIYEEKLAAYKAQLTPAQAAALKEERTKRLAKRRSFRKKRELTVLGKPKRPRSGFNIFVSENFQKSVGASPVAKLKKLFETWQNLPSSEKQPYLQLAEDDKVRYENEMKSWEAKMAELGRQDLIRSKEQQPKKKTAETAQEADRAKAPLRGKKATLKLKKSEE
ncbi:Transcription factor A, mitochondrial [Aix galericulata]|nr:Transcription factor A, mitochondrial [Aix galericulata]